MTATLRPAITGTKPDQQNVTNGLLIAMTFCFTEKLNRLRAIQLRILGSRFHALITFTQ